MQNLNISLNVISNKGFTGDSVPEDIASLVALFIKELQSAAEQDDYRAAYTSALFLSHQARRLDTLTQSTLQCEYCGKVMEAGEKWFAQIFAMATMYLLRSDNPKDLVPYEKKISQLIRSEGLCAVETAICKCGHSMFDLWEFNLDAYY